MTIFPVIKNVIYLVGQRANGHRGGWNQGRPPLISDLSGFYNWLPADSLSNTNFNFLAIAVFCIFVFILYIILRSAKVDLQDKFLLTTFILIYFYFLIEVYVRYQKQINNYNLIKYGQYLVISNILIFASLHSHKKLVKSKFRNKNSRRNLKGLQYSFIARGGIELLSIAIIVSQFLFTFNWVSSRQFTVSNNAYSKLSELYERYDIYAVGFPGAGTAALTIPGDLHFANESRGFGVKTLRSTPTRELIVITPAGLCPEQLCKLRYDQREIQVQKFGKIDSLDLFKVVNENTQR